MIQEGMPAKIDRITWNPKYSVHVEVVDAQHRELFSIMNRLADLYESGSEDLFPVLQDLVQYATEHFHAENMIMLKAVYPGFRDHNAEHSQFIDSVQGFLTDHKRQDDQLSYRIMVYIRDWLLSHTQQVDMQYADFLIRTGVVERVSL